MRIMTDVFLPTAYIKTFLLPWTLVPGQYQCCCFNLPSRYFYRSLGTISDGYIHSLDILIVISEIILTSSWKDKKGLLFLSLPLFFPLRGFYVSV